MNAQVLFEILVRENAEMLVLYLRSVVRDSDLVDDLFQETMLTAWKRLDDYDKDRPFGPWLRGIAAKLILAHRRQSSQELPLGDEEFLAHLSNRHEALHRQPGDTLAEKLDSLQLCLAQLPEHYRETIEGRYHQQLSPAHLADQLGLSLEAVKKRLQRARELLLACLKRKLFPAES